MTCFRRDLPILIREFSQVEARSVVGSHVHVASQHCQHAVASHQNDIPLLVTPTTTRTIQHINLRLSVYAYYNDDTMNGKLNSVFAFTRLLQLARFAAYYASSKAFEIKLYHAYEYKYSHHIASHLTQFCGRL